MFLQFFSLTETVSKFKKKFIHLNFVISQQVIYTIEMLSLVLKKYTHIHTTHRLSLHCEMPSVTEERGKDRNPLPQTVLTADLYMKEFKA